MERVIERCAGLDVHNETVAACVRVPGPAGQRVQQKHIFGTTTSELLALRDWLEAHGITQVAMESTGVFWKPVYAVLEDRFTCLVVNAAHIKQVPGRKTDMQDCAWIAQLLEHGLLRGSFVPPVAIRDLRELTRYRKVLIEERARAANRVHKALQGAGIKLGAVATNILGTSGRAMLEALVQGTTDATILAELARGSLRKKLPALRQALAGCFRPHHAFLVGQLLAHLDYLDEAIATVSCADWRPPGAVRRGTGAPRRDPWGESAHRGSAGGRMRGDMAPFPSDRHLASWAGLCPGHYESAGKRKS